MGDLVLRAESGGLSTLTLNRADKLNALSTELFEQLDAHLASLEKSDEVRCVVIRGAGKCFSTGNDLAGILEVKMHPNPNFQSHVVRRLANLPQPVIAAVHGHCYTGALELALAADIIVAAESARFADTHARFSLVPVWGMSQRLPRRVGAYTAREMMFTCRTVTGQEAAAIGLAAMCVPDDNYEKAIGDFADLILAESNYSQRAVKRLMIETDGLPLAAGLTHELDHGPGQGPDILERIAAFQNRLR